jgi:hypothetical protein
LFVGSTPWTSVNDHSPSSTSRISKHVAAVFAYEHRAPLQKRLFDLPTQPAHPLLELAPWQRPVANLVPVAERLVRQPKQVASDLLATPAPVDHRLKIATQVHHPNAINNLLTIPVIPFKYTTHPYAPRGPRQS